MLQLEQGEDEKPIEAYKSSHSDETGVDNKAFNEKPPLAAGNADEGFTNKQSSSNEYQALDFMPHVDETKNMEHIDEEQVTEL